MVATVERLIAALNWFEQQSECRDLRVKQCHPSTSSAKESNDLMLEDDIGRNVVLCEVCDVASSSAGQNGKERNEIKRLGCTNGVPADCVRRFICTSPEFARAIQSVKRQWGQRQHRYREYEVGDESHTIMLELISSSESCAAL